MKDDEKEEIIEAITALCEAVPEVANHFDSSNGVRHWLIHAVTEMANLLKVAE